MAEPGNHPTDLLQDAIDGRLDDSQRTALEAHLATCEICRREMAVLRWTKSELARAAPTVPEDLVGQLRRSLDREDDRTEAARAIPPRTIHRRSLVYGMAAVAAVVAIVWFASRGRIDAAPAQAAADFRALSSGSMPLDVETSDVPTLEARFRSAGLPFPVRVFDFGMMNYSLLGGGVHRFQGRPSALFAYRGADGGVVVCQMYEGEVTDLPPPAERRRQNDIDFLVYRDGDLTIVFWEEGDVLCVLVADGDPESAIRLAVAKAVKA